VWSASDCSTAVRLVHQAPTQQHSHSVQQELSTLLQTTVTDAHSHEDNFDGYVHDVTAASATPVARHLKRQHICQRPQSAGPQLTRQTYASGTLDSCSARSSALLLLTDDEQQQQNQQQQPQQQLCRARPHTAGARTAAAAVSTAVAAAVAAAAAIPGLHKEHWPEWRNGQQQARHSALITRHCEHLHRSGRKRPFSAAAAASGTAKHLTTAQQLHQARLRDTAQRRRRCAKAAHEALLVAEQEQRRVQSAARLRAQVLWPQPNSAAAAAVAAVAVKTRPASAQPQWRVHRPPLYDAVSGRLIVTAIAPVATMEAHNSVDIAIAKQRPCSARPASATVDSSVLHDELQRRRHSSSSSGSGSSSSGGIASSVRIHSRCHTALAATRRTLLRSASATTAGTGAVAVSSAATGAAATGAAAAHSKTANTVAAAASKGTEQLYDDDGILYDTGYSSSSSRDSAASSYCSAGALAAAITTAAATTAAAAATAAAAVPRQRAQSAGPTRAPLQRDSYSSNGYSNGHNGWMPQTAALQPPGVVYLEPFRYDWQRAAAVEAATVAAAAAVVAETQQLQHCLAVTCMSRQQLAWLE
jgi:hypothetical protein